MEKIKAFFLPRSHKIVLFASAGILLLAIIIGAVWALDPYHCRIAPDVSIGGVDVSGLTWFQACSRLNTALQETLYSQPLTVQLPKETLTITPDAANPKVSVLRAVWAAYQVGRSEDAQPVISLAPYLSLKEEHVSSLLQTYADTYDTDFLQTSWYLEGQAPELSTAVFSESTAAQTLVYTKGVPHVKLDIPAASRQIADAMAEAISACRQGCYRITVSAEPLEVPQNITAETIYAEICTDPVNDSLDLTAYCFVPGSYGYRFSAAEFQQSIDNASDGEILQIPLTFVKPEILGDQVYFRDVLGTCDTRHNNNENRNNNLRLVCQAIDGFILQPGEEFSYNAVVGERTRERGYLPAPAYSGNRLVDSVGGGVCQGSTTLYNCVLLADLEVVFRACHGASVGYVPVGLDAAVNYLTTDFKFRNNFHFPIMIRAEVADGYVKMQILGTDEKSYYIKMESRYGEDDIAVYARSYKCKYNKETDALISRDLEAYSTYYKNIK
ncbi:MAG: VanW family protein [Oscillospiraceae bacterium]|nr:VanW family protein [Oscillospiraceae bacterium]